MHTVLCWLAFAPPSNRCGARLRDLHAALRPSIEGAQWSKKLARVCVATFRDVHDAVPSGLDRVRWVTSPPASEVRSGRVVRYRGGCAARLPVAGARARSISKRGE
jgi:hypothetical protein